MIERLPRLLAGLLAAAAVAAWQPACARQDELVVGINAGVSAGEGLDELRQRFRRLGEAFSQATRQKVRIEPLYSSLVEKQLARDSYPFFIVHTHHALQVKYMRSQARGGVLRRAHLGRSRTGQGRDLLVYAGREIRRGNRRCRSRRAGRPLRKDMMK